VADVEGEGDVVAEAWDAFGVMVLVTSTSTVVGGIDTTVGVEEVVGMVEVVEDVVGTTDEVVGKVGESMDATADVSPPRGLDRMGVVAAVVAGPVGVGVVAVVVGPGPKILLSGFSNACLR
jgi:hypothetical protein